MQVCAGKRMTPAKRAVIKASISTNCFIIDLLVAASTPHVEKVQLSIPIVRSLRALDSASLLVYETLRAC